MDEVSRRPEESLDEYIGRLQKLSAAVRDALLRAQHLRPQETRPIRRLSDGSSQQLR